MRKSRSSIFIRYALSYIAVVLLLFFSITGFLYVRLSGQARRELIDNQMNRLSRIAGQHETYISAMLNTAEEIGFSPYIEFFRYDEEPWKAYDLQLQLVPYTTTSTFCNQIYLHFFGDDRIYSSSSSMSLALFARMMRYEYIPMEKLSSLIGSANRLTILPSQHVSSTLVDSSSIITFLVPLGSNPASGKGVLVFLIKDDVYQALFADAARSRISTYVFQDDMLLSASEEAGIPREQVTPSQEEPVRTFRWENEDWTQVTLSGQNWGLSYSAVLRNADINSAIARQIFSNLAILPVFVVLSLVLALWMAQRHAKPIRAISGLLSQEEPDTRRDELQQISTGIRQLTTRNLELTSRLDQALPVQRHDFIFGFVKGRFSSRTEAVEAGKAVEMEIDRPFYAIILCSGAEGSDHPLDLKQPPFTQYAGFSGAGVELVALKANLYLIFSEKAETIFALAEQIRREGLSDGGRCVTASSAVHADFMEAPAAYLEAAAAYENRFVKGDHGVLFFSEITTNLGDILPQARKITTSISQALTLGNREVLDKRIDDLLHFLKNTDMSPFAFRMIYNDVIHSLIHTHVDALSGDESILAFNNIFSLTSCQSIDDLDEMLRRLCDYLMTEKGSIQAAPENTDEMTQVVRYMEEHYSDPEISITALADSCELSTARFSLSFKEKTGMSPLDYLTLLRVEHAKELLSSTSMTIRDISMQVGYYDSGSFIRRFKQVTSETPLQYRRGRKSPEKMEQEESHENG
ncbi:MAG: helix-turn-helix transcriptional regulator [Clostridia bacterium]|nr:helix-turn-helix transcriptional regulator [Clostridia bacterium]